MPIRLTMLAIFFMALPSLSAESRTTITVPFEIMAPFKTEDNGVLGGVHKDLLDAIAKKMNVNIKYTVVTFARSLLGLKNGTYDLTIGKYKTPERDLYLHYLDPPTETKIHMVLFVRKGDSKKVSNFADLRGLNIATMNGRIYSKDFDGDDAIKKFAVTGVDQQFNMLLLHRVDAAMMTDVEGMYAADKMGVLDKIEVAEFSFFTIANAYCAVSKKSKLMGRIGEIETIVSDMATSGETDRIYENYFKSRGLAVPSAQSIYGPPKD